MFIVHRPVGHMRNYYITNSLLGKLIDSFSQFSNLPPFTLFDKSKIPKWNESAIFSHEIQTYPSYNVKKGLPPISQPTGGIT